MALIGTDKRRMVIGTGKSGLSCARYLRARGLSFDLADTRESPPAISTVKAEFPDLELQTGALDGERLARYDEILLSPGIDPQQPSLRFASEHGALLIGDVELFWREAKAPIVAITGTNAKSTVTTLVGMMAQAANINVRVGGNLGTPALELLDDDAALYVLELSSFQLETVAEFRADVACVLNLAPDHLDRYPSMQAYYRAKQRIYSHARAVVYNREDPMTAPLVPVGTDRVSFGLNMSDLGQFGVLPSSDGEWLAQGVTRLMPLASLALRGRHNAANALAAMAIATSAGIELEAQINVLKTWSGLAHRCQFVDRIDGVDFVNDSKATNVAAAVAGLNGFAGGQARTVLIAGGVAKEDDFSALRDALTRSGRALVLIGEAADLIESQIADCVAVQRAGSMQDAVHIARALAQPGDTVLLSPACASFDMFNNYEERGDTFIEAVASIAKAEVH